MLTAKILGGLSNQMFQIATVYALALDNNDECAFPFDRDERGQGKAVRAYTKNIFKHIKELPKNWKPEFIYKEPTLNYVPIPYRKNMMLDGYFPCVKYFDHRKKEIFALFKDKTIIDALKVKYSEMLKNSVSIHVRRGDYLKQPAFLVPKPIGYYRRALVDIDSKVKIDNILIFSDDIKWCKKRFADKRITFIEGNTDYEDLYLQSLCSHNITSNSGFSTWGAYLNENKKKIIYAPAIWFGTQGRQGITDNYLKGVIKI
jgi:CDP-glycerol glycerophosphotransferase (TagB/SpsB family)